MKKLLLGFVFCMWCPSCSVSAEDYRQLETFTHSPYTYEVEVVSVYDGDTVTLDIDLGFNVRTRQKIRLFGINTPELRGGTEETKAKGRAARDWLRNRIMDGEPVHIRTHKDKQGKYGRYLGTLYDRNRSGTMTDLNYQLIKLGHGVPYYP